jgi:hypothetical protein
MQLGLPWLSYSVIEVAGTGAFIALALVLRVVKRDELARVARA